MIDKPLMESSLLPLAYMAVNGQGDNVDCVCEACAIEQAGGSIDSYNLARGFDWGGEWIDPPDEGEDEDEYQKSKGLAVGDPVYVLFGEGLTINQVRCFDLEGIAETLGIDVNNIEVRGFRLQKRTRWNALDAMRHAFPLMQPNFKLQITYS